MKGTARTRLVDERKRRQWSQQKVADHIGTTQHNVSRWGTGLTTPGPYFRTKLCEIFGLSAQELGLFDINPASPTAVGRIVEPLNSRVSRKIAAMTKPSLRILCSHGE